VKPAPTDTNNFVPLSEATLELVTGGSPQHHITSQQQHGDSLADVYEYKGRYFAVDESGLTECGSAFDAFVQAGIGLDT
jgi:hypothetical protein